MKPCYKHCLHCGTSFLYKNGQKVCSEECKKEHEKTMKIMRLTALREDEICGWA